MGLEQGKPDSPHLENAGLCGWGQFLVVLAYGIRFTGVRSEHRGRRRRPWGNGRRDNTATWIAPVVCSNELAAPKQIAGRNQHLILRRACCSGAFGAVMATGVAPRVANPSNSPRTSWLLSLKAAVENPIQTGQVLFRGVLGSWYSFILFPAWASANQARTRIFPIRQTADAIHLATAVH